MIERAYVIDNGDQVLIMILVCILYHSLSWDHQHFWNNAAISSKSNVLNKKKKIIAMKLSDLWVFDDISVEIKALFEVFHSIKLRKDENEQNFLSLILC